MSESDLKATLRVLAEDAMRCIQEAGGSLDEYRNAVAFFNPERDKRFTELPSFSRAVDALDKLAMVRSQSWPGESRRLALQFLYAFCRTLQKPEYSGAVFDTLWTSFWKELSTGEWTDFGVSNLQNFRTESKVLDLGDGITIRARSFEGLRPLLGWDDRQLTYISDDWDRGAYGSHVLIIEHITPKAPQNFLAIDGFNLWVKVQRALLALRLLKAGDIRSGRMFLSRRMAFNVGLGGMTSAGFTVWHPGKEYHLEESEIPSIKALYDALVLFETKHKKALPSVDLALRSFSSLYDRYLHQAEDKVLDAVTALEALLGERTEIAFKLAFRTAGLLAASDAERVELFEAVKTWYETRSRIVHGDLLKDKHLEVIRDLEPLVDVVRQLLVGFVHLSESIDLRLESFKEELDSVLQHAERRIQLRKQMGFA